MSIKSPECWASDPNAHGLRIDLAPDHSLMLPYNLFLQSELISDGKSQELRFVFASYEVLIRGHCLRRLDLAMQRQELSSIVRSAGNSRNTEAGQPIIFEITVTEIKPEREIR